MDDFGLPLYLKDLSIGATVKAKGADGVFGRADVVDLVEIQPDDGRESVKVHWWGTKPAKDKWLMLQDIRLIKQFAVDWDDVRAMLPIRQDPESRAQRLSVFQSWCAAGKKSLTLKDLEKGVNALLKAEIGQDLEEASKAVNYAWKAARNLAPSRKKAGAKRVDVTEFHAFIIAFRYYLELAELFEHLDACHEDDQKLSLRECRKGLEQLSVWGVTEEALQSQFVGVDVWTPKWKFADFAKFCVEKRWTVMDLELELDSDDEEVLVEAGKASLFEAADVSAQAERRREGLELCEQRKKIMDMFKQWDDDNSGEITRDELTKVITTLNPSFTPEICNTMFNEADSDHDGSVDYEEFCFWLFSQDEGRRGSK